MNVVCSKMKLKNYIFLILLIAVVQLNVSMAHAQSAVDAINQLKTELYLQTLTDAPLSVIDNFELKYEQTYNSWCDEDKLVFDNILAIEKINFSPEYDAKQEFMLLQGQDLACEEFFKDKKPKDVGKWFLTSWADIKSRFLAFLSGMDMYAQSEKVTDLYREALKKDKNFSPSLLGYGLWSFHAPVIAGGGYDKALEQMSDALQQAETDIEIFFALCFRSQVLFAMGREEESLEILKKVRSLFPKEILTSMIRDANANGKTFF